MIWQCCIIGRLITKKEDTLIYCSECWFALVLIFLFGLHIQISWNDCGQKLQRREVTYQPPNLWYAMHHQSNILCKLWTTKCFPLNDPEQKATFILVGIARQKGKTFIGPNFYINSVCHYGKGKRLKSFFIPKKKTNEKKEIEFC